MQRQWEAHGWGRPFCPSGAGISETTTLGHGSGQLYMVCVVCPWVNTHASVCTCVCACSGVCMPGHPACEHAPECVCEYTCELPVQVPVGECACVCVMVTNTPV